MAQSDNFSIPLLESSLYKFTNALAKKVQGISRVYVSVTTFFTKF